MEKAQAIKNLLSSDDKGRVAAIRDAIATLRNSGFKAALAEEALNIQSTENPDLTGYALERADISGFVRCMDCIFGVIDNG